MDSIGEKLVDLGCDWEGSHLKGYISIDVPKEINYLKIKAYLEKGFLEKKWDYKESCLSDRHTNHSHSEGGEWKAGTKKGKAPRKRNKVTISSDGTVIKTDG